ncbi:MAG: hypothetical protein M0T70_06650 [Geobacteraceae bacterium]|nr:hypothetical protein [Geobacteraceae bacterium]
MKRPELDIYRDLYPEILNDIWDKLAELLTGHGMSPETAEYAALLVVEWIRTNWGGQIQVARRLSDPRPQKQIEIQDSSLPLIDVPAVQPDPVTSERFRQFRDQVSAILAQVTPERSDNATLAAETALLVQRDFRGEYIPKVPKLDQLQRDREIWLKFRGSSNMDQLVRETGLSVIRIYQIRAEVQKRKDKHDQPLLPFFTMTS